MKTSDVTAESYANLLITLFSTDASHRLCTPRKPRGSQRVLAHCDTRIRYPFSVSLHFSIVPIPCSLLSHALIHSCLPFHLFSKTIQTYGEIRFGLTSHHFIYGKTIFCHGDHFLRWVGDHDNHKTRPNHNAQLHWIKQEDWHSYERDFPKFSSTLGSQGPGKKGLRPLDGVDKISGSSIWFPDSASRAPKDAQSLQDFSYFKRSDSDQLARGEMSHTNTTDWYVTNSTRRGSYLSSWEDPQPCANHLRNLNAWRVWTCGMDCARKGWRSVDESHSSSYLHESTMSHGAWKFKRLNLRLLLMSSTNWLNSITFHQFRCIWKMNMHLETTNLV